MFSPLKKILLLASGLVLLLFVLLVVNQTAAIVDLAARLTPALGTVVLWGLIATYALLIAAPLWILLRLPRAVVPPARDEGPEFDAYLTALRWRLSSNPRLRGLKLDGRQDIERALQHLGVDAERVIRDTAAAVFLSTAISQSGRLDAFVVLAAQIRMVNQIARIYYQRPRLSELTHLYANVAATAFVAGKLEDIDVSEHVGAVVSNSLGAAAGAVPGLQVAAGVLVNSVLTGSANAFLTLRVGIITRRYCASLSRADRGVLRRSATAEAAGMLGSIVKNGTSKVSRAVWDASRGKVAGAVSRLAGYAKSAGAAVIPGSTSRPGSPDEPEGI